MGLTHRRDLVVYRANGEIPASPTGPAVNVVLHPIPCMTLRILKFLESIQVDPFVLQCAPEPVDERVVHRKSL